MAIHKANARSVRRVKSHLEVVKPLKICHIRTVATTRITNIAATVLSRGGSLSVK
jgi:hypothetical protein